MACAQLRSSLRAPAVAVASWYEPQSLIASTDIGSAPTCILVDWNRTANRRRRRLPAVLRHLLLFIYSGPICDSFWPRAVAIAKVHPTTGAT